MSPRASHRDHDLDPARLDVALTRATSRLIERQGPRGAWPGDYGGPGFLTPMYVCTARVVGLSLSDEEEAGIDQYFTRTQNDDGGFGLHVESPSYVFTTTLVYVAWRQLGVAPDDPRLARARRFLDAHGGPTQAASWGKFFLTLLGLHDYAGLEPVLPELWLLPPSLPLHPSHFWCHCRVVYLPMSWLYGTRSVAPISPLTRALREELYPDGYARVDWTATRGAVAATDRYAPRTQLLAAANLAQRAYDRRPAPSLRQRALAEVLTHIGAEDRNTNYLCLGPVNKLYHCLVWHFARPDGAEIERHRERLPLYLSRHELGLRMNGYDSSELWDTAFAVQALAAATPPGSPEPALAAAFSYIDHTQVREDVPDRRRFFRHRSRGGWPFSSRDHGWPISDCTAEGLKACLELERHQGHTLPRERLAEAVDLILSWQNEDGGWATYERTRGPRWLERLNPSDCFADIMLDYSWVECTSACVQALVAYQRRFPTERTAVLTRAVERGRDFIIRAQRTDGSWEGGWGICFTYGTWFGVTGLRAAGLSTANPRIQSACDFLAAHQGPDGGWGERAASCREHRYLPTESGQVVMTSWALLALIAGGRAETPAVARGLRFLLARQQPEGGFPAERIAGIFNRTCAIHYDNYRHVFPVWALARAREALAKRPGTPGLCRVSS